MIAPYQAFPTADRPVMIAAGNDGLFRRLCAALGLDDLAGDPRFASNADRVARRDALAARIAARTATLPAADLLDRLRDAGVPAAPIHDVAEVVRDPQVRASGIIRDVDHPEIPGYAEVAPPLSFDGARPATRRPPPSRGAGEDVDWEPRH